MEITVKDVMEFLKEKPEALEVIKGEYKFMSADDVRGLVDNKNEILLEKKKLQEQLKSFEGVTPEIMEEYNELRDKLEAIEAAKKQGKGDSIELNLAEKRTQRQLETLQKELEASKEYANSYKNKYLESQRDKMLNKAFKENNVDPVFGDVLSTAWGAKAKLEETEKGIELYFQTESGEVPLAAYAKEFFDSESGKSYLRKPNNVGGGGIGSLGSAQGGSRADAYNSSLKNGDFGAALRAAKTK